MAESPPDVTLTAGASDAAGDVAADLAPGAQLGRYRLVRVLGAGGMGVVWAALDPDLDREVALKVLRSGDAAPAQRARLLREARAMAKVHHANVITVHEVGTAAARDFVAMEIVHGRTAAEWLASRKRSRREVMRVFGAAGRGLAAAHAVGLVHRDFKPHNVLLDDDDRVVVTDFGLARAMADVGPEPPATDSVAPRPMRVSGLEQTVDATSPIATSTSTPRDLGNLDAALTEAGAVLGTPAYMAPEQIDGAAAGPRADQFAYCVALWQALCGERPFKGASVLELRAAMDRPPTGGAALRRRVRAILRRGLELDPAKRWPDMGALLHAIERAERPRGILVGGLAAAAIVAVAIALAVWPRGKARIDVPACRPLEGAHRSLALAVGKTLSPNALAALTGFEASYFPALEQSCAAGDAEGLARADCLAGEAQLAGAVVAGGNLLGQRGVAPDYGSLMPATVACYSQPPPSIPFVEGPAAISTGAARANAALVAMRALASDDKGLLAEADDVVAQARDSGSCVALAEAQLARAEARAHQYQRAAAEDFDEASTTAERCRHDLVRAHAALGQLALADQRELDRDRLTALRASAVGAIERAGKDPLLTAHLEVIDAEQAWRDDHQDDAITHGLSALTVFEDRRALGIAALTARMLGEMLVLRGGAGDLGHAGEIIQRVEQLVEQAFGPNDPRTAEMIRAQMMLAWKRGERALVAALRARVADLGPAAGQLPIAGSGPVRGQVVDAGDRPVAGAQVVGGVLISGDDTALDLSAGGSDHVGSARTATTAADGTFELVDVPPGAWMVAQAPDGERSLPLPAAAAGVLRVGPTSKVTGHVELGDKPATAVVIEAVPPGSKPALWSQLAPLAPDGSFTLDHLARGRWRIRLREDVGLAFGSVGTDVDVDRPEVGPIELVLERGHASVQAVVRADRDVTIPLAQITALPGRFSPHTLDQLVAAARSIPAVRNVMAQRATRTDERAGDVKLERGDLLGTITGLAPGETTVCAIPFGEDTASPSGLASLYEHGADVDVTCQTITIPDRGPTPSLLFVVPPMKRIP